MHHTQPAGIDPVRHLLAWGVAIPALYFGVQIASAPFFPDYSFFSRDASALGSSASRAPWIFNAGTLALGLIQIAVAGAFASALIRARVGRSLSTLIALALASSGVGTLNAFLHPLPDPRHTEGPLAIIGSGFTLLPLLCALVLWRLGMRRAALATGAGCLALLPVITGLVQRICIGSGIDCDGYQFFLNNYHGLLQRAGAALIFVPIGLVAYLLRRRAPSRVTDSHRAYC